MIVVNLEPWTVTVYSSFSHYGKEVEELTQSFRTREDAKYYADMIKRNKPQYFVTINFEL